MLLAHIPDDCFVKVIPRYLDRSIHYRPAKRNHSNISSSAADIHNHVPARLGYVYARSDCRGYRLFYKVYFPRPCRICCFFYRFLLYLCHAARHADADTRLFERAFSHRLLDKILDHLLCHRVIRDNALPERPDSHYIARCPAEHQPGLFSYRLDRVRIPVKCNDRRFLQYYALALHIYEDTGSP